MPAITFIDPTGGEHTVDAEAGQSLMMAAVNHDIPGIEGECGGDMACGTCHVYVSGGGSPVLPPRRDEETEMLEVLVDDMKENSRLGCQITVTPDLDGLRVTVA
jgi:2Fe-2S ferredoxin